jgi:hypothetical protein
MSTTPQNNYTEKFDINIEDHAIQGKMIIVSFNIRDDFSKYESDEKDYVKRVLANKLAIALIESNLIEFTQQLDPITFSTIIKARCFVTPDEQVRILRTKK